MPDNVVGSMPSSFRFFGLAFFQKVSLQASDLKTLVTMNHPLRGLRLRGTPWRRTGCCMDMLLHAVPFIRSQRINENER